LIQINTNEGRGGSGGAVLSGYAARAWCTVVSVYFSMICVTADRYARETFSKFKPETNLRARS